MGMTDLILIEQFDGHPIEFQAVDAFVNLTAMCQPFGKRPGDFLAINPTKAFQAALAQDLGVLPAALVTLKRGNFSIGVQGTWAHPDLALECARWLSPALAIWCNRIVRKILAGILPGAVAAPTLSRREELLAELAKIDVEAARAAALPLLQPKGNYGEIAKNGKPKNGLRAPAYVAAKCRELDAQNVHACLGIITQLVLRLG